MKDFAQIIEENSIKMGYIPGSEKVLFIKCGQGSSIYGYENKYLSLAWYINEKYGCTVFVSEILDDGREAYNREMEIVASCVSEDCKIYCLGVSKGGLLTLWYGANNPLIKRIATVNAPLMINFHNRTRPAIQMIPRDGLTMFYGTEDPSFKFVPFISSFARVQIIEGADHNLCGGDIGILDITIELLN